MGNDGKAKYLDRMAKRAKLMGTKRAKPLRRWSGAHKEDYDPVITVDQLHKDWAEIMKANRPALFAAKPEK